MELYFTTSDMFFQDNPEIDIHRGRIFSDCLNLKILNKPIFQSINDEMIKHININQYEVTFYVEHIIEDTAFVRIKDLLFFVDNASKYNLLVGKRYQCTCEIYHDIWNDIALEEENLITNNRNIEGKIIQILFDTGTNKSKKSFFYQIEKIDGWREIELYPQSTGEYLIEINIDNKIKENHGK